MNLHDIKKLPVVYKTLQFARSRGGRAYMKLQNRLHGVAPKRVFFSSFAGKAYSDNPRYISEALHKLRPDLEIVWQLSDSADRTDLPDYVRTVPPRSLQALKELATVRCFVDNFNRVRYLPKFPGQLYVQTWHGDRGFKKMMFDMEDGVHYPDYEQMDLAVSGSDFGTNVFHTAFRYNGEILQVGMPRNDCLVNPDPARIAKVKKRLNISADVKVMLYAPTFRDATAGGVLQTGVDLPKALTALESATGSQWLCLVRAHDLNSAVAHAKADNLIDVTHYPEMAELMLVSDLLLTDYSSSASDFVLLDRPAILYQPDLAEFTKSDRNMYFDLCACPHLRAESEHDLLIMLYNFNHLPRRGRDVLNFYGANETGCSAEAVAQWISDRISR